MEFVDKNNDIFVFLQLNHERLDPLLELSPVLRSRDNRRHVKVHHAFAFKDLRDALINDLLGKPLDNGCFAYSGLADKHGVVFLSARKDLHDAFDFFFAADDRVKFSLTRKRR